MLLRIFWGVPMAKKRIMKSERGVVLTEAILFGGQPRKRIGTQYVVSTPKKPEGRIFETIDAAAKYFHVQLSLAGRKAAGSGAR